LKREHGTLVILAEYCNSDGNGVIMPKKRMNSAKMGIVGSFAIAQENRKPHENENILHQSVVP
jgi:hypothetical protein